MQKLQRIRELDAHVNPNPSYLELFHRLADLALKKLDPELKKGRKTAPPNAHAKTPPPPQTPRRPPKPRPPLHRRSQTTQEPRTRSPSPSAGKSGGATAEAAPT